ncbi:MAG: hypothetical protein C0627_00235 [Sulfurimonas sp.]|nr:MAG: hypothetical protein C0627_00235 [Sulfurimonas sp.]
MVSELEVTRVYVATFNRAPDAAGLAYWVNDSFEGNAAIEQIAQSFFDSAEAQSIYVPSLSVAQRVSLAYLNLFGREADAEGLAYWVDEIDNGRVSQSSMILALVNGAQDSVYGMDATTLANKSEVGLYYAQSSLDDVAAAYEVMEGVTSLQSSVSEAKAVVDCRASLAMTEEASLTMTEDSHCEALAAAISITEEAQNRSVTIDDVFTYDAAEVDEYIDALYSLSSWSSSVVTYSFNDTIPSSYYSFYDNSLTYGWSALNTLQREAVRDVFEMLETIVDVEFVEVESGGDMQYNITYQEASSGFAFYPGGSEFMGDVFLGSVFNTNPQEYGVAVGEYGWSTIVHETGHALGLKHPFEGYYTLDDELDNFAHSVMSYDTGMTLLALTYIEGLEFGVSFEWVNPESYSVYDILTLQEIYGASLNSSSEDNIYSIEFGELKTIWDSGGVDTLDFSRSAGSVFLDMQDGSVNTVGYISIENQIDAFVEELEDTRIFGQESWVSESFYTYETSLYTGEDNFAIAYGTVIENLVSGDFDDVIFDNEVDNIILLGKGNDKVYLYGGWDYVDGADGYDTVYFDALLYDVEFEKISADEYLFVGDNFAATLVGVESVVFSDGVVKEIGYFDQTFV